VPIIGWHGEQNAGAFEGAASIAAGCSTLAASHVGGDPSGAGSEELPP
jgi:hypothetical protein